MKKTYKNLFFDLDGTISDSSEGIFETLRFVFEKFGCDIPGDDVLIKYIGPPLKETFSLYLPSEKALEAVNEYKSYYKQGAIYKNRMYDGIPSLLSYLKDKGYRIFMATTKSEPAAKEIARGFGIADFFDGIYGTDDARGIISKTDVLSTLLSDHGFSKEDCVMIGDTVYDVNGALDVGIDFGPVFYGFGKRDFLQAQKAAFFAETVAGLKDYL